MIINKLSVIFIIIALLLTSLIGISINSNEELQAESGNEVVEPEGGVEVQTTTESVSTRGGSRATTLDFTENSTGFPATGKYNFIAFGDFNKDGDIDVGYGAEDYGGGSVLGIYASKGNGGTSWTNASTGLWSTTNGFGGIAFGDADNDGDIEIYGAIDQWGSDNASGLKVWEYRSSSWTDSVKYVKSPLTSGRPDNVVLMNITGDNRLDIVVSNSSSNGLAYFENTGGNPATWKSRSDSLATSSEFTAIAVADMNKDGLKDIVANDYSGGEHFYVQQTTGSLWGDYSSGISPSGTRLGVTVGDANNDSHMDIIYGGHGNGIKCYLGNSGGSGGTSFSWTSADTGLPTGGRYPQIQVADIDLDGDLDIIAPEANSNSIGIEIYLGNGTENPGNNLGWTKATTKNLTTSGIWYGSNVYDINGDGSLDIVGASWGSGIKCYLNKLKAANLDLSPPGKITDAKVVETTTNSIKVNWTAPADNGTDSGSGPVQGYDIRYNTVNITIGNWGSAIQCTGEPVPASPGTKQEYNVTGLDPATQYFIAVRTGDERPNLSPLSNIVVNTTYGLIDKLRPGQITDLAAVQPTNNSINLTWTAPADNGTDALSGPVMEYDIRYHSAEITNGTWASATKILNPPTPGSPGTTDWYNVTALTAETKYYFAVKARDERPNWNYISNSPFNITLPDPDVTPPAAVSDLTTADVTQTTINLTWTAVGDNGTVGTASTYDIRYATSTITDITWPSATQVTGEPTPKASGNTETFQVTGLSPDTTYYFAIKTADAKPNWSPLSNIATGSTATALDITAPAAIMDLTTDQITETSVRLSWTAPGDDGNTGTVSGYSIRYHTATITDVNWATVPETPDFPTPASAGNTQYYSLSGLLADTQYFFAVKSYDERPNWSPLSNIADATTLVSADTTPPSAVDDLTATALSANSVNLSWTAVGDDGLTGSATGYDIRYSTATITDTNWAAANVVSNSLIPKSGGSSEYYVVTGLFADATYYFAIKSFDEKPNYSPLSNIASATTETSDDITPPAKITDLAVVETTESTATITWTAPGDDGSTDTATAYDIRYAEAEITETSWGFAIPASSAPTPKAPGEMETFQITDLDSDTTYYFAVKAADEVPNWGPVSNSPSGKTLGIAKPQLIVTVTPEKTSLYSNETMDVDIKVESKLDLSPLGQATVTLSSDHTGLMIEPSSSQTDTQGALTVTITAPLVTSATDITIFADVTKTDFKSNRSWATFTVIPIPEAAKFNLRITSTDITFNKSSLIEGDAVTISAKITNTGTIYSSAFWVKFYVNDTQLGSDERISLLRSNEDITVERSWITTGGTHTIKVELTAADPGGESDSTDNSAERTLTVEPKDDATPIIPPDKDKEEKEGMLTPTSILLILIVIIIIVVILAFVVTRRKRKEEVPPPYPSSYPPTAPVGYDEPIPPEQPVEGVFQAPPAMPQQPEVPPAVPPAPAEEAAELPPAPPSEATPPELPPVPGEAEETPSQEIAGVTTPIEPVVEETTMGKPELVEQEIEAPPSVGAEPQPPEQPGAAVEPEHILPEAVSTALCPTCQQPIQINTSPCPSCGTHLNWS